jgi:hypothetical protein
MGTTLFDDLSLSWEKRALSEGLHVEAIVPLR